MTKEHVWPKFLIEKNDMKYSYNEISNRLFAGDLVVKDVCAACNNVKLSALDAYLAHLFAESFSRIIEAGEEATFKYSYELLLRTLLKISFNSARASKDKSGINLHAKFANYILNGGYHPQVMLRLQIVTASKKLSLTSKQESDFRPQILRSARIMYDGPLSHRFLIKLLAINSFWFYLIIPLKTEPQHKWKEMVDGFSKWKIQPGQMLTKKSSPLNIPANQTTYFDPRLLGSLLDAEAT